MKRRCGTHNMWYTPLGQLGLRAKVEGPAIFYMKWQTDSQCILVGNCEP